MDHKKIKLVGTDRTCIGQERDSLQGVVKVVMKFWFPKMQGIF